MPCTFYICKDPSLWKENKASSGAEDNAKSAEVGTGEAGPHLCSPERLKWRTKLPASGKILENKV